MRPSRTFVQWLVVALLGLAAFVLGLVGFTGFFQALGDPRSFLDILYLTLQLFVLESGSVAGPLPWELELARLLAPTVAAYTAVRALAILFRRQLERFGIRFLRGHVVICGLGRKGLMLAKALRERGDPVVIVEEDAENDLVDTARAYGVPVVIGDSRDPQLLRTAGVARATHLVAVSGDDGVNAEVAVRARSLVHRRRGAPLNCLVHIVDPDLCTLLRMQEVGRTKEEPFRLDFFNVFESGARVLLSDHPPAGERPAADSGPVHMVVVGLGQFGESLVLQAAGHERSAPGARRDTLRITVVDRNAAALAGALTVRHPWLVRACRLEAVEVAFESTDFARGAFLLDPGGRLGVSSIYVCVDDDSRAISVALALHRLVKGQGVPVVVRMVHGAGLASLLEEDHPGRGEFAGLHAFGLLDRMCDPDLLFAGVYETLARAIHEEYVRQRRARSSEPPSPAFLLSWDELAEDLKEANRAQAAHIGVKLAAVGCDLAPLRAWDTEAFAFRAEEVEKLAEMEHERWVEDRRRAGWVAGARDDARKRSPSLVRWEELSGEMREMDRAFIRGLPSFLASAGFQIVRREAAASGRTRSSPA
jgi:hypothetical protein